MWGQEDQDLPSGTVLANAYRLSERIGRGAYGSVYRAEQISLHRDVAVKVLSTSASADPELAERFVREACAVSRLHHPNTVTVLDFGRSQCGRLYLVMEYVPGMTLTELVTRAAPLPLAQVVELCVQVAMALEAIHAAGIIHADLKSENILCERLTRGELVKVVDFGIARLTEAGVSRVLVPDPAAPLRSEGAEVGAATIAAHARGTPGYIAPEVILGAAPEPASDIYAAGILLYFLLTAELPFGGRHAREVLRRQLDGPVMPPSLQRRDVPESLDALVLRATARKPGQRFADASALRDALEVVAHELPPTQPSCDRDSGDVIVH